jgi:hypothetical protein
MVRSGGNISHRFLVRYLTIAEFQRVIEKFFLWGAQRMHAPICSHLSPDALPR